MKLLITGGAGFIGANTADRLLREGHEVVVLDNLSRAGSQMNLAWLRENHPGLAFARVDVRDAAALRAALDAQGKLDAVFHFAAQVAVTTSVEDPRTDFEVNALGTLNLLEAVRGMKSPPVVLYASTNKVYGALSHLGVVEGDTQYRFEQAEYGVSESTPLEFYSPYGCSKGAADQYMLDYHRIYGLPTIVFRNSCIYGPRQFGVEDQGWVAWFIIAAVMGRPITIYGDGKQVRDLLYIDDLIEAMMRALGRIDSIAGQAYNIGGGPRNTVSIWREFGPLLEEVAGENYEVAYAGWRPGDQRVYVSDIRKAERDLGWSPKVTPKAGIRRLHEWVAGHRELFEAG